MNARRGFLVKLAGLAVTPPLAARLLPDWRAQCAEALRTIATSFGGRLPYAPPRISGGFLVPPEYQAELLAELNRHTVVRVMPRPGYLEAALEEHRDEVARRFAEHVDRLMLEPLEAPEGEP